MCVLGGRRTGDTSLRGEAGPPTTLSQASSADYRHVALQMASWQLVHAHSLCTPQKGVVSPVVTQVVVTPGGDMATASLGLAQECQQHSGGTGMA